MGLKNVVSQYLGFARFCLDVPWDAISLRLFANPVSDSDRVARARLI